MRGRAGQVCLSSTQCVCARVPPPFPPSFPPSLPPFLIFPLLVAPSQHCAPVAHSQRNAMALKRTLPSHFLFPFLLPPLHDVVAGAPLCL